MRMLWIAVFVLLTATGSTSWKMVEFHNRLRAIQDNAKWEQHLGSVGAFARGSVLLYGDSQVAFWPLAESFGMLAVRGRGVKGELAADSDDRFTRELAAIRPALTVILTGTNDLGHGRSLSDTLSHIERMLGQIEGHAIVCGLLPTAGAFALDHPSADIRVWNEALKKLAAAHGARYVDFFAVLADESGMFEGQLTVDGLHPNARGYAIMTMQLLPLITKEI